MVGGDQEELPFAEGQIVAGRWRTTRLLGSGSFGWVVAAERVDDGAPAALKILRADQAGHASSVERFVRRELEILKRVHATVAVPQVVRALEPQIIEEGPRLVMVLELVDGPTLADVLTKERMLDQAEARAVLTDLAIGLAAIHAADGVHRDLKPENVRLRAGGGAVILDLGIAKALWNTEQLTKTASAPMTPLYASPEQLTGEEVGPPADIFALGLIGYEMLVGAVPLSGRSLPEIIRARSGGTAPDLATFGRPLSADLARTIHRCLARSPRDRPSAADVVAALRDPLGATSAADTAELGTAATLGDRGGEHAHAPPRLNSRAPVAYDRTEPAGTVDHGASQRAPRSDDFTRSSKGGTGRRFALGAAGVAAVVAAALALRFLARTGPPTSAGPATDATARLSATDAPASATISAPPAPASAATVASPSSAATTTPALSSTASATPTTSTRTVPTGPRRDPDLVRTDDP